MASGIVAKKIALFEIKPQSFEQQCRLKRKHAIRRKRYRGKERRIIVREGTSMIALSNSDENINQIKDYDEDDSSTSSSTTNPHYSQYSASCSALFDMDSVESTESGIVAVEDSTTLMEIIPKNKRLFLKSGSKENFAKRLNIIDIDIEIKIEKKEEHRDESLVLTTTCCDDYEPLSLEVEKPNSFAKEAPAPVVTTDRIHLTALVDDNDSAERSVTYYCSNCFHPHNRTKEEVKQIKHSENKESNSITDDNVGSSPEPLYENIFASVPPPPVSLGAPPLPPKRLFGDTFTTNYSCLPAHYLKGRKKAPLPNNTTSPSLSYSKNKLDSVTLNKIRKNLKTIDLPIRSSQLHGKNKEEASSDDLNLTTTAANNHPDKVISDHVTEPNRGIPLLATKSSESTTETPAICLDKELRNDEPDKGDDAEEPFYEDLYDYVNGPDKGNNEMLDPLLELFRDQLNSLEQNVEDEVEYCDCSTILSLMNSSKENNEKVLESQEISPKDFPTNQELSEISSLKSYEIYDDCFGVEAMALGQIDGSNNCDISDDIGSMPKSGAEKNANMRATSNSLPSHILSDYIKGRVAKASSTPSWRKITSPDDTENVEGSPTTKKAISAITSSSNPNLLSVFPSLSNSKTKLVEPNGAEKPEESGGSLPNESSVIVENERNVCKTKSADGCIYAYGMLKNSNGNSKPRFGGRPVIAHPMDEYSANNDKNNEGAHNDEHQSGDRNRKTNKKDDNEIFNKPLPLPPSNTSPYESVYEEPIYGITNQLTATYSDSGKSSGGSPGKRRSSAPAAPFISNRQNGSSKPGSGSTYSHSPSISSGSTYGYSSGSVNDYGDTGSTPKYGQSVASPSSMNASVSTTASDGLSIYGVSDKLPPTPQSKFSSIAKTAGRKIAKKFLGIRKNSKCGLEESLTVFSTNGEGVEIANSNRLASSPDLQGSKGSDPSVTSYNKDKIISNGGNNGGGGQIRRPISRPSIPPPEPPKNEGGTTIPNFNDKGNDYKIYDKKNDDDYEDSDFYDSDSELIRNFVSQVQPIYSMEEEPLYQYYTYGISLKPDDDYQPVIPKNLGLTLADMLKTFSRPGQRTLWCELPGVVSSGILSILSEKQKQLQEAIFEILTSEVSYLKSLDVLITLFYKNEELIGVLTEDERNYLFGNIEDVRECSQAFLSELLGKWDESWYIQELGEIISRNTETRFSVYKEYCRNKPYQDKTMQSLRHSRDEFVSIVKAIEEDEKCQMLQIDSFLMLPMQRITRLPLLVNAVIQRTAAGKEKSKCEEALKCLTNLVLSCNDAARESQDAQDSMAILEKLEFTRGIKALPDLGQFIMKGDFMKNPFDHGRGNQINWTFRKAKRTFYWLLLFSKQLLVARRKANARYEIIDMVDPLESSIKALPNLDGVSKDYKHFFMLHFSRKETVYFLAARTNSEVERWKSKLDTMKPKEELRVEAIFPYDARRPDEMSFYVGDVIRVSQMQPDGWYFGTKLATGESGWFPGNYCCENAN